MADLPPNLPPETPNRLRGIYAVAFFVAAFLGVIAYALAQIPPISSGIYTICRETHVCAPAYLRELHPLSSGFEPGNTVEHASKADFEKYSQENLDWEICLRDTRSWETHEWPNRNYRYRIEGTFYAVPKWRGLSERIWDIILGRTYTPTVCTKG